MTSEFIQDKVIKYLIKNGKITSWEAINNLDCTRLSAVIFVLKKKGYKFNTIYNPKTKYATYFLLEKPQQLTLNL